MLRLSRTAALRGPEFELLHEFVVKVSHDELPHEAPLLSMATMPCLIAMISYEAREARSAGLGPATCWFVGQTRDPTEAKAP